MADCLISFGSNLGDGRQAFAGIRDSFRSNPRIGELRESSLHSTRPIGGSDPQANYLNAAIRLSTNLDPKGLLLCLLAVERQWGRVRSNRWGPRTADLDLLLYDRQCLRMSLDGGHELLVPHPRLTFRRFVLTPAVEIAADMFHPLAAMTIGDLLKHLDATANVIAFLGDPRLAHAVLDAIAAPQGDGRQSRAAGIIAGRDYTCEVPETIDPHRFPSTENRFAIALVDSAVRWDRVRNDVKLIVCWRRDRETTENPFVREAAGGFAGPRLELETDDAGEAAREIMAAMAAMLPGSVE